MEAAFSLWGGRDGAWFAVSENPEAGCWDKANSVEKHFAT
jgi:hypothetical protein